MLNTSSLKKRDTLKILTLPLLVILLSGFNVKDEMEYVNKHSREAIPDNASIHKVVITSVLIIKGEGDQENKIIAKDKFRVTINKNTSDEKLKEIKDELKANHGIDFNYAASRNNAGEIVSLSINYRGNGNNGNFVLSQDVAIDAFDFFIDEDGKAGIWSEAAEKRRKERFESRNKMMEDRNKDFEERQKVRKERFEENKTTMEDDNADEMDARFEERREMMEQRRKEMKARMDLMTEEMENLSNPEIAPNRTHTNDGKDRVSKSAPDDPIYYVDGKEVSKNNIKTLGPEDIEKVEVLKGEKAIKKYGGKGMNGVVEITTKKQ